MSDTIFSSPTAINPATGQVNYGDDSRLHVRFFRGTELHGLQSQEQARPVYVGVDMVEIRQPGERDVYHGLATAMHKMRFEKQWQAYQAGQEYIPDGTPLEVIFAAEPETVANLKYFKVHTVEQLAALNENAISRLGLGARQHVNKAQKFMEAATGYQAASQMNREVKDLKSENDTLKAQLEAMQAAIAKLEASDERRGPGRPRKIEQPEDSTT